MSDREEIRWKLKNLQEIISAVVDAHQSEQDNIIENWKETSNAVIKGRNTTLGAIGFGIILLVSLVSIGEIDRENVNYIPMAIIVAFVIYLGINAIVYKLGQKFYDISDEYNKDNLELLEFKGWIIGYSMREDVTFEQIKLLILFVQVITQSISYHLKNLGYKKLNSEKPDQDEFRTHYDNAKKYLNYFEKINVKLVGKIKSFISEFEDNE